MSHLARVRVDYQTPYSNHRMTLPTRPWVDGLGGFSHGGYYSWGDDSPRDADDMIKDFLTKVAKMYNDTTSFNHYTIETREEGSTFWTPRTENALTIAGSGTITGWDEAVQRTYMIRDTSIRAFNRLVLLDAGTDNQFGKYTDLTTDEDNMILELTDIANAWASQQNNKPATFKNLTITLNEKLRREYKLT